MSDTQASCGSSRVAVRTGDRRPADVSTANGGAGSGIMPRDLVQGRDAQAVADFVAQASGG